MRLSIILFVGSLFFIPPGLKASVQETPTITVQHGFTSPTFYSVPYSDQMTVGDLMSNLENQHGINKAFQKLMFDGTVLGEPTSSKLKDLGIVQGSAVYLALKDIVYIEKGVSVKEIEFSADETLANLKERIATAFNIPQDEVDNYTLESVDGHRYEEYEQSQEVPLKTGMRLTMRWRGKPIEIIKTEGDITKTWYLTQPYGFKTFDDFVQIVKNKIGADPLTGGDQYSVFSNGIEISDEKSLRELGVRTRLLPSLSISSMGEVAAAIPNFVYKHKIETSIALIAFLVGVYGVHRSLKTDWFSRWWYDRLGRYKKLTEKRQEVLMTQLAELYAWREEHLAHEQTEESSEEVQQAFEMEKEGILRPFSPEDREKLEYLFKQYQEKEDSEKQQHDGFVHD